MSIPVQACSSAVMQMTALMPGWMQTLQVARAGDCLPAGRERQDGAECWVAVASQAFSRQLLEDMPLQEDGRPLPPGKAAMAAMAPRMWREVQELLRGLGVGKPEQEPLFMQAGPVCLGAERRRGAGLALERFGPRCCSHCLRR